MPAVKQELQEDLESSNARSTANDNNFDYRNAAAAAAAAVQQPSPPRAAGFKGANSFNTRLPIGYIASTEPDCKFFLQFGCSKVRY
jgi:hypothetical protein